MPGNRPASVPRGNETKIPEELRIQLQMAESIPPHISAATHNSLLVMIRSLELASGNPEQDEELPFVA